MDTEAHPIRLLVDDDLRRSRLTVFFRLLLALPHIVWLILWTILAIVLAVVHWLVTLVAGRPADGLHRFYSAYVRYTMHVYAYLLLAANPFPGFVGERGYPVDVELPARERQSRLRTLVRVFLALPALLLATTLVGGGAGGGGGDYEGDSAQASASWSGLGVAFACAFLAWFVCLARGRTANGLRDLTAYSLGYAAQASAFLLLVTDRYPNSDPLGLAPARQAPEHPIALRVDDDGRRSRLTVLFRLLLALPHLVWLILWTVAAVLAAIPTWFAALVTGRPPRALHRFLAAFVRYSTHVYAFVSLVANPFPGFTGTEGSYPVDLRIAGPERQRRLVTLFRLFLLLPAALVSGALSVTLVVVALLGWFASLVTGRMPQGLRNFGAVAIRYDAQLSSYGLLVTGRYPHAGPGLLEPAPAPEPEPEPEPPFEPAAA